ncbi:MAG: hypothetical protein ACREUA_06485, partial [Burkholderiales bacterium]
TLYRRGRNAKENLTVAKKRFGVLLLEGDARLSTVMPFTSRPFASLAVTSPASLECRWLGAHRPR